MKSFLATASALAILAAASVANALPVFPGAVGYGTDTVAGRAADASRVYKVTRLDDPDRFHPPSGTLRYGIEAMTGPRVIVFEVSGVIALRSDLIIKATTTSPAADYGYLTIAGQTAPYPGITLKNGGIRIYSHDVLIQHISIRPGAYVETAAEDAAGWNLTSLENRDCLGTEGLSVNNIVVDHISCGWSTDEVAATWWDSNTSSGTHTNITISNSIFARPIVSGGRTDKPQHGFGVLVGPGSSNVTLVRNIMAFATSRNPLIRSATEGAQVVNNFIYRPGPNRDGVMRVGSKWTGQSDTFLTRVSAIGNLAYLMRSRDDWQGSTTGHTDAHQEGFYVDQDSNPNLQLYLNGNYTYQPDVVGLAAFQPMTSDATAQYSQPFYSYDPNNPAAGRMITGSSRLSSDPYVNSGGTPWSPILGTPAYLKWKIVPGAGKFPAQPDYYDAELMNQINNPDDDTLWLWQQSDLNNGQDPWAPVNIQNTRAFNVPANPTLDDDGDGYTNLEEELQRWAAIVEGRSSAVPTDPAVSKFDTFSDEALDGWTTAISGTTGSWAVTNNTLVQSVTAVPYSRAMLNGSNWTDQVIEAKVDASAFNGSAYVAVFARFRSLNDAYYLALLDTGGVELRAKVAGVIRVLGSVPNGTYDPLAPHVLRLEVVGNSWRGFVDGALVISATDDQWGLASGKAGVGMGQASASFDNVFASPFPSSYRVTDDFDDGDANGWDMTETGASAWSTAPVSTGSGNWSLNQTLTTGDQRSKRGGPRRDQSLQANVRFTTPSSSNAFVAVFARYQDLNNTYYLLLRNSRTLEIKKILGGTVSPPLATLTLPSSFDLAAWHTLRIEATGDKLTTLKGYLDGQLQLVASDVDSPLVTGWGAMGTYITSAQFDDLVISAP